VKVEISNGDLVDKLTILGIKLRRMSNGSSLEKVRKEYEILRPLVDGLNVREPLLADLKFVNFEMWNVEDRIREKERTQEFDEEFISLARSVYRNNDRRFKIKRQINQETSSEIEEQKSYEDI
jgi:hypothetical protein